MGNALYRPLPIFIYNLFYRFSNNQRQAWRGLTL